MKIKYQISNIKIVSQSLKTLSFKLPFYVLILTLCISLIGCEAFVRKFTRKPKKSNLPQEEMVLAPEEYKGPQMTKEELYRQHFMFWKSWQDELMMSLSDNRNNKKQLSCIEEAIKSLLNMRAMLNPEMQKKLDIYINRMKDLQDLIKRDPYGVTSSVNFDKASRLKMDIMRDFSYSKIKSCLA